MKARMPTRDFAQVQETKTAEAVAREVSSLVERLHAANTISAVSDATKDLHTAISKLEKARSRQQVLAVQAQLSAGPCRHNSEHVGLNMLRCGCRLLTKLSSPTSANRPTSIWSLTWRCWTRCTQDGIAIDCVYALHIQSSATL
jgi:hypothetical protein